MKLLRKIILAFIIFCLIVIFFAWQQVNSSFDKSNTKRDFVINRGETVKDVGHNLAKASIIKLNFYFDLYIHFFKRDAKFQAGTYELNTMMSIKSIADKLALGQATVMEQEIKIIEGWNIKDIDAYLSKKNIIPVGQFFQVASQPIEKIKKNIKLENFAFLNDISQSVNLEGFLSPDTYKIYKEASVDDIILKLLENFEKKLTSKMLDDIKKQKKDLYSVLIMASLLEKEAVIDPTGKNLNKDAEIISGIFWKRLANRQYLESCATLAYILGENKPQFTYEDTHIDSPYNTYRNFGLPPGPICNPSLEAIKAAIYPETSEYFFFLNDLLSKKTIFSRTYDEHLTNKAKYLK